MRLDTRLPPIMKPSPHPTTPVSDKRLTDLLAVAERSRELILTLIQGSTRFTEAELDALADLEETIKRLNEPQTTALTH